MAKPTNHAHTFPQVGAAHPAGPASPPSFAAMCRPVASVPTSTSTLGTSLWPQTAASWVGNATATTSPTWYGVVTPPGDAHWLEPLGPTLLGHNAQACQGLPRNPVPLTVGPRLRPGPPSSNRAQ
jgi:hypothetical protein